MIRRAISTVTYCNIFGLGASFCTVISYGVYICLQSYIPYPSVVIKSVIFLHFCLGWRSSSSLVYSVRISQSLSVPTVD